MNKIWWIILVLVIIFGFFFWANKNAAKEVYKSSDKTATSTLQVEQPPKELVKHIKTPEPLKSVYMSACAAGTPSFRESLISLAEKTEINAIVIDVKDFSGTISFPTELEGKNGTGCTVKDMKEFIELLHSKNIYTIARITVFQDPYYTKAHPELAVKKASDGSIWKDYKGLSFIEVGAKSYWDYVVKISEESYAIGFDEMNFDYVRFPSDGNMKDIYYPNLGTKSKQVALEEFFTYLGSKMRERGIPTSVDLFGMVTTNTDDLNIGQVLERALPHFDYVAPMVYPSHYPNGFNGWANPDDHVYETVEFAMSAAVKRATALQNASTTPQTVKEHVRPLQLRTWIQDFDYGGTYGVPEVRAQIKATYDVGLTSFMVWDPSNKYTRDAYLTE